MFSSELGPALIIGIFTFVIYWFFLVGVGR